MMSARIDGVRTKPNSVLQKKKKGGKTLDKDPLTRKTAENKKKKSVTAPHSTVCPSIQRQSAPPRDQHGPRCGDDVETPTRSAPTPPPLEERDQHSPRSPVMRREE
jgi:hypothetical protein